MTEAEAIQSTALLFVLAGLMLTMITFIAGFNHDLRRMQVSGG